MLLGYVSLYFDVFVKLFVKQKRGGLYFDILYFIKYFLIYNLLQNLEKFFFFWFIVMQRYGFFLLYFNFKILGLSVLIFEVSILILG